MFYLLFGYKIVLFFTVILFRYIDRYTSSIYRAADLSDFSDLYKFHVWIFSRSYKRRIIVATDIRETVGMFESAARAANFCAVRDRDVPKKAPAEPVSLCCGIPF